MIIVTGANESDQYRRLERQLRDAATYIRENELRECDLKVRYDQGGNVSVEVIHEEQEFRKDGWPLCPRCGEDELASDLLLKGDVHRYERRPDLTMADYLAATFFCYQCQWRGLVNH